MMMRERMTQDITNNPIFKLVLFLSVGITSITYYVAEEVGKECIAIILDVTTGLGWMGVLIAFAGIVWIVASLVRAKIDS